MIRIAGLRDGGDAAIRQAAELLLEPEAFNWATLDEALAEVRECLAPDNIARMAVEGDTVLGWTGAQQRSERIWELHPLVVSRDRQRQGIGRALVSDIEQQAQARGARRIFVAADNDVRVEQFTVWTDLYPNLAERLRHVAGPHTRQYEFYERHGYVIVGVVPDGNGLGNLYMARRIGVSEG